LEVTTFKVKAEGLNSKDNKFCHRAALESEGLLALKIAVLLFFEANEPVS